MQVPLGSLPSHVRYDLVLEDWKGLNEFVERLSDYTDRTDPRRVLRLVLRNVSCAESGHYPASIRLASEHLKGLCKFIFGDVQQTDVQRYLALNKFEARIKCDNIIITTLKVIESAKVFRK